MSFTFFSLARNHHSDTPCPISHDINVGDIGPFVKKPKLVQRKYLIDFAVTKQWSASLTTLTVNIFTQHKILINIVA